MTARQMQPGEVIPPGEGWITTTTGMSGHFAVHMWINNEDMAGMGPFAEPWDTGIGRYRTLREAQAEAHFMAVDNDLPFDLPGYNPPDEVLVQSLIAFALTPPDDNDIAAIHKAVADLKKQKWTNEEIIDMLKWLEHVNPHIKEDVALRNMALVKKRVDLRLKGEQS